MSAMDTRRVPGAAACAVAVSRPQRIAVDHARFPAGAA